MRRTQRHEGSHALLPACLLGVSFEISGSHLKLTQLFLVESTSLILTSGLAFFGHVVL